LNSHNNYLHDIQMWSLGFKPVNCDFIESVRRKPNLTLIAKQNQACIFGWDCDSVHNFDPCLDWTISWKKLMQLSSIENRNSLKLMVMPFTVLNNQANLVSKVINCLEGSTVKIHQWMWELIKISYLASFEEQVLWIFLHLFCFIHRGKCCNL
jgi:hypothetical protein